MLQSPDDGSEGHLPMATHQKPKTEICNLYLLQYDHAAYDFLSLALRMNC